MVLLAIASALEKGRRYVANQGGSLYAGMADMILKKYFESAHFRPQ
jgi:hypothetical protein